LISNAYSHITVAETSTFLGLTQEQTVACIFFSFFIFFFKKRMILKKKFLVTTQNGWQLETDKMILIPKKLGNFF